MTIFDFNQIIFKLKRRNNSGDTVAARAVKWAGPAWPHKAKTFTGLKWAGSLRPKARPA
jgi:hypothetical protein